MIRSWLIDAGGALVSREVTPAPLDDDRVLVEVHGCVIGSAERRGLTATSGQPIPGGAAVGTVVETGPAATGLRDKRVLVGPLMPCGECDTCRRGAAPACPQGRHLGSSVHGTVASHVVARGRWLLPLEGKLDVPGPEAALLAREAAVAYAAFARAGVNPGEPVVIVGDTVIARITQQVAIARSARPFMVDGTAAQTMDAVNAAGHEHKPVRIFETSGSARGRALALSLANPGATVVLLSQAASGSADEDTPAAMEPWIRQHVSVLGIAGAHPDFLAEVVALAVREQLDVSGLTQTIGVDDLAATVTATGENSRLAVLSLQPR